MNNFVWYSTWMTLTCALYIFQAFLSVKHNNLGSHWSWIFFFVSLFTPWFIVSKISQNLVLDALIFDTILILSYSVGLVYFTNSFSKFSFNQYFGIFLILSGLILFKKGI